MSEQHHIITQRTARYYTLGDASIAEELWIVLHGYAHRAEAFIELFTPISTAKRLIVAPEALSRFYTKGFGGSVGASWMTREDRLNEIADYIAFLNNIYIDITKSVSPKMIVVLGFSQGVPAMMRWLAGGQVEANTVILWSGDVPRDLDFEGYKEHTKISEHIFCIGSNDTLVHPEIYKETEQLLADHGIECEKSVFEGGHEIPSEHLLKVAAGIK